MKRKTGRPTNRQLALRQRAIMKAETKKLRQETEQMKTAAALMTGLAVSRIPSASMTFNRQLVKALAILL